MGYFGSYLVILWLCHWCHAGTNMIFSADQDCKWSGSRCVFEGFCCHIFVCKYARQFEEDQIYNCKV